MKIKLTVLSAALALLLLLCACKSSDGNGTDETTKPSVPENGIHYEYSDGGKSDRIIQSTVYENGKAVSVNKYDYWTDGRLKSITTCTADGEDEIESWHYNYTEEGTLHQMVRSYDEDGFECRDDYRYNSEGKIETLTWYSDDEYCGEYRYSYNEKGDTTREEQLDSNGDVIIYTEYSFDENGKTESSHKYMYGSVTTYSLYSYYEESGLLSAITYYSGKGEITLIHKYEYNSENKLTKAYVCESDGTVAGYTESLYDEDGFNYRDIYYENGSPVYRYDYTKDGVPVYSEY